MSHLFGIVWDYIVGEDPEAISGESLLKLISLFIWSVMYIFVSMNTNKEAEWSNRTMSLLHGVLTSLLGAWQCGAMSMSFECLKEPIKYQHYFLMLLSWGYFAYDLVWCIAYWTESALMLVHHISALLFITRFMHKKRGGCIYGCAICALEITNPCLQIRWFLREAKYNKSIIFMAVELIYLVSFVLVRGVLGTFVMYKAMYADMDVEVKIMGLILWAVSIAFIADLYRFVKKKWRRRVVIIADEN